ncbi:uncharacterized protein LOC144886984 isoform X1 [Branchiostoma floridae x Branchiostoma japonicum]
MSRFASNACVKYIGILWTLVLLLLLNGEPISGQDTDDCIGVICQNGGICIDGFNNYTCNCTAGFEGVHCETANVPEETTTFVNGTSETAPPTDVTNTTTAPVQHETVASVTSAVPEATVMTASRAQTGEPISTKASITSAAEDEGSESVDLYVSLGCWRDTADRAIPVLEGTDPRLYSVNYLERDNATEKCYQVAFDRGFRVFAVQDGGQCFGSADAHNTYKKYGPSTACAADGEGGPWANEVYQITGSESVDLYVSLGCWRDTADRAIPVLEGTDPRLYSVNYLERDNATEKCYQVAFDRGFRVFAVQDDGACMGSADAHNTYKKYGPSTACAANGEGGPWANEVYQITGAHTTAASKTTLGTTNSATTMMTTIPTTLSDTTLHYTSPMTTTPTAVSKTTTEMHLATEDHPLSTHYEVRPEVSIRPSEVQDVAVGEIITIKCHTTRRLADYNYQWTVDGTLAPSQRGEVFRYEAASGVHKVKCKVTSSGRETESEDSTVTVLQEGAITFTSSIRLTGRNFTPEMANPNSDAFKAISTEIKDWYRQAMRSVQGSIYIRVKDAKPGSVITSQNINVLNPELQDKDLYDDIFSALRTAVQAPDSLGLDPNSLTLMSATTCYGETVTVTDQSSNRVNLTFPSIAGDTHAYSIEKCADNTENAGVPLAVRRCTGSFDTGVSWSSPELLDCGLGLSTLAQIPVTPDNVAEVAADLQILTSNGSSLMAENIADASTVLANLANTTGDQNVGYSVVVSVDQILNTDDEVLYQSQVKDQSLSRIVRAIEQFNDRVNLTTKPFRRIEQNIGVETYKIGAAELNNSVGFASLDGSEDLEDGSVQSYSDASSIPNDRVDASIVLPAELASTIAFMRENLPDSSDVEVRLSFIIYQNSRLFQSNQTASSSKTRVNSRIIASRVTGFEFKNLSNPVVTRYLPIVQNSTNHTVDNIRCVFWNFQAEGGAGAWSTEGCNFVGMENGRVVCECNHLTNFAVLTDIYGGLHSFALDVISKVGIALSITGLTLTLITYMIFKQLRQTRPQHILTHLCSALLATLIIFLAGIDATTSPVGCTVVAFLLHYFLLAVFMWMAVEAFNMYLAFVKVLGAHVSRFILKAAIFAWGLPLLIAIATVVVDVPSTYPNGQESYRSTKFCWLQGNQLYFGFLLPAGLVLLFNTIVYITVISKLVCGRNEGRVVDHKSGGTKQNLRIAIAVMVLVGLTWVFGFFMISDGRIVFSYLFCIFNSLQGFFIFIFHTLRQKEVQNLWFKCCACFVDDARTTKTSAGKSSSNLVESNEESYSRGAQRGNAPESVPMEVYME